MIRLEIGVCDNDSKDLKQIEAIIRSYIKESKNSDDLDINIQLFQKSIEMYEASRSCTFDLVILYVEMQEWSGFELAEKLYTRSSKTKVIFVSEYENLVFDSYEYSPLWFIRKSQLRQDITRAMRKYLCNVIKKDIRFRIKVGTKHKEILLIDITYIECTEHTLIIHMLDKDTCRIRGSLKSAEKTLSKHEFYRIHKNYLVNRAYIKEVRSKSVLLRGGIELDMGKGRKKGLLEAMNWY